MRPSGPSGRPRLQTRPGLAAVGRLPDAAARAAAVHAARRAPALIGRRVEDLAVRRVHHQVVRAGVVVAPSAPASRSCRRRSSCRRRARRPGPRGCRSPRRRRCRCRAGSMTMRLMCLRGAEAHVDVGLAAVGRLVDAVAPRRALAVVRLAGADPDEVGVVLRDGDVADRHQALVLELRLERRAVVRASSTRRRARCRRRRSPGLAS